MSETRVNLVKNLLADPEGDRLTKLTFLVVIDWMCDCDTLLARSEFDKYCDGYFAHLNEVGGEIDIPEWSEVESLLNSNSKRINWDWIFTACNQFIETWHTDGSKEWCDVVKFREFIVN